jgi:hypothetical protein
MAYPSYPLCVWLVENNNPFAAAPGGAAEVAQFRSGVVALLKQWYAKVIQNSAAPAPPAGWKAAIDVNWSDLKNVAVGDRDVVIYFSPLVVGASKTGPQSVRAGPYKDAVNRLPTNTADDKKIVADVQAKLAKEPTMGGLTLRPCFVIGGAGYCLPIVSEIFLLYDRQFPKQVMRVKENVVTFAVAAWHESAHNKYEAKGQPPKDRVHEDGGGGVLVESPPPAAQAPNDDNIKFLAGLIWNWGPQYVRNGPLSLVKKP